MAVILYLVTLRLVSARSGFCVFSHLLLVALCLVSDSLIGYLIGNPAFVCLELASFPHILIDFRVAVWFGFRAFGHVYICMFGFRTF